MRVQTLNKQSKYKLRPYLARFAQAFDLAWRALALSRRGPLAAATPELSLSFLGPRQMKALNAEFRGVDETTDVLSFPAQAFAEGKLGADGLEPGALYPAAAQTGGEAPGEEGPMAIHLGDIVICPARAAEQALAYGHSLERELVFLGLHGFLHLVGYDHETPQQERKMRRLQTRILSEMGLDVSASAAAPPPSAGAAGEDASAAAAPLGEAAAPGFRSGFVAIVGRPNAGKSTLLNQLSGEYLAITSPKAQTTRSNARCIIDGERAQVVFIDTPGLHRPEHKLGQFMMEGAAAAIKDCDVLLLILDVQKRYLNAHELELARRTRAARKPVILALNKIDRVEKPTLLPLIARLAGETDFAAIVPISALEGDGAGRLMDEIVRCLPEGPRYYRPEDYTDQTERGLASELIREKILRFTNQEIPHGTGVIVNRFEERFADADEAEEDGAEAGAARGERRFVRIEADILCERESHKIILLGKGGAMLKRIGSSARIDIEAMLGCKVHLQLFVKVRPDWRNRPGILNELGYRMPRSGAGRAD